MRITLLTAGTRGDVQPYVALGAGLRRAGYQVRVAAGEDFASFVTQFGLEYFPIRANFAAMVRSEQAQAVLDADNPVQMLIAQLKASQTGELFDRIQDDIWEASQRADAILLPAWSAQRVLYRAASRHPLYGDERRSDDADLGRIPPRSSTAGRDWAARITG